MPIIGTVLADSTTSILARSVGLGQVPFAGTLTFNPPFPEKQVDSTSATFVADLAGSLVANLQVQLGGSLGARLDPLVNGTILPTLKPIAANALAPALGTVLAGVADPALRALGVGLGELVVTIDGVAQHSPPRANDDFAQTPEGQGKTLTVQDNDARVAGDAITISSLIQPAHGTAAANPDGTITYIPAALYRGPDSFAYTITNGVNGTSTAPVWPSVTPVNNAPTANPNPYAVVEDGVLTVAAPGVLGNGHGPRRRPAGDPAGVGAGARDADAERERLACLYAHPAVPRARGRATGWSRAAWRRSRSRSSPCRRPTRMPIRPPQGRRWL